MTPELRKIIVGGVIGTAAIVIIVMLSRTGDELPKVTTNDRRIAELGAGETLRVTGDDELDVEPADASAAADREPGTRRENASAGDASGEADAASARRALGGQVVNAAGEPLSEVSVRLVPDEGETAAAPRTTTDAEGAFELQVPAEWQAGELITERDRYERASLAWTAPEAGEPMTGEPVTGDPATGDLTTETTETDGDPAASRDGSTTAEPVVIVLTHETAIAGAVRDRERAEPCSDFLVAIQRFEPPWPGQPRFEHFQARDGRFYFGPLQPGNYKLWAYRQGKHRTPPIDLVIAAGEFRDDLEFALEDGYVVTGAVYSRRTGLPVSGAMVYSPKQHLPGTVNWIERTDLDPQVQDAARTDALGRFTLEDLAPGEDVVFRVLHTEYAPADFLVTVDASTEKQPVEVPLRDGNSIRGSVIDETGAPVTGTTVMCFSWGSNPDFDQALTEGLMTTVDERGEYELRNLNPAQYWVFKIPDLENPDAPGFRMANVRLGPDDDVVVDFVDISELATLYGRVFDESGRPLADMSVSASTIADGDLYFRHGTTDEEGRYEIKNLRLDTYSIHLGPASSQNMPVVGEIELNEVKDYARDYTFVSLELSGKVTYETGQVPPYSEIILLRELEPDQREYAGMVWTDEQGSYRVVGLQPGRYRLVVTAAGHARTVSDAADLDKELHRSATIDVSLPVGARVAVQVVDTADEPVVGILVYILDEKSRPRNRGLPPKTDALGRYTYSSLAPGKYTVSVVREGAEPVLATFEAVAGDTAAVRIRLP